MADQRPKPPRAPRWAATLAANLLVLATAWLLLEGLAGAWLWYRSPYPRLTYGGDYARLHGYIVPDTQLGYTLAPNAACRAVGLWERSPQDRDTLYDVVYHTNALGRRQTPYPPLPQPPAPVPGSPHTRPLLFFGDSYTLGQGVASHQAYPALVAQACTGLQPANLAVHGYGPQHALLLARQAPLDTPAAAVYLYIQDHLHRATGSLQTMRGWVGRFPWVGAGPGGQLVGQGPMRQAHPQAWAYRLLGRSQVLRLLGVEFSLWSRARAARHVADILNATYHELQTCCGPTPFYILWYSGADPAPLAHLNPGIRVLDAAQVLRADDPAVHLHAKDPHPNARGHRQLAALLARALAQDGVLPCRAIAQQP